MRSCSSDAALVHRLLEGGQNVSAEERRYACTITMSEAGARIVITGPHTKIVDRAFGVAAGDEEESMFGCLRLDGVDAEPFTGMFTLRHEVVDGVRGLLMVCVPIVFDPHVLMDFTEAFASSFSKFFRYGEVVSGRSTLDGAFVYGWSSLSFSGPAGFVISPQRPVTSIMLLCSAGRNIQDIQQVISWLWV